MKLQTHDPLNVPAAASDIKSSWKRVLEAPITTSDGSTFQFDRDSRYLMEGALEAWDAVMGGKPLDWRLNNNTTVTLNKGQLQSYLSELKSKQALRGFTVDTEYLQYKAGSPTLRDLKNWEKSYGL